MKKRRVNGLNDDYGWIHNLVRGVGKASESLGETNSCRVLGSGNRFQSEGLSKI